MIRSATAVLPGAGDPGSADEARWVAAARAGDAGATLRLLNRCRPPLLRLLTGVTGDLALAEDLAQEAFLQAFRHLGQLRDVSRFYPWVRRTALRLAIHRLRRRREMTVEWPAETEPGIDPARRAETRLAVQAVLGALPVELRVTLVLRELEQLDYEEIAEALAIPVGTVRSRLFNARQRFKRLWREMEESQ
jgi:RNA polymerase sigma-70 factor (ECF subfamily)